MNLLHRFYKRGVSLAQVDRSTAVIVKSTASSQLVYLITVEGEISIHIVIPFGKIFLPFLVGRVYQIDITFPSARQVVTVLSGMRSILKQVPFFLYSIRGSIFQGSETKIVEHGFHTETVLCFNVVLHRTCINLTVSNVHIYLVQLRACAAQRPVVLIVPVLKLHPVDMVTVQICHLFLRLRSCLLLTEISDKTVARETCRVTGYIYRNRADYHIRAIFLTVNLCHVSFEIGGRRLPRPAGTVYRLLSDCFTRKAITYFGSGRQSVVCRKYHLFSRFIESLIRRQADT